jgi:hypothetical protein
VRNDTQPNAYFSKAAMSALGQKQTFAPQKSMSALPPKADKCGAVGDVGFGPIADVAGLVGGYEAFAKATGTTDKELFKIEGATHIETYWVPKYVDAAMGKLTPFFGRTLVSDHS